jgi:hypothetical protein
VTVANEGFHDVDYHSGEPFDGTDWPAASDGDGITWATVPYEVNPDANALRWGTLYNFRFDANFPPGGGEVTVGLFRPGTPGEVQASTVVPVLVPFGDIVPPHGDGEISVDELLCVVSGYANAEDCPAGDLVPCGGDGLIDVDDLVAIVYAYGGFFACPHPCPP